MSSMRIAICEDEAAGQNRLMSILKNCSTATETRIFSNCKDFLKDFHTGLYDLIFMDIYMNGMNGVDAITAVRKLDAEVCVAFTTSSLDHALSGYRLNAIKYIEKPVNEKDVMEAVQLAQLKIKNINCIHLRISGKECNILQNRICFVEQRIHSLLLFLTGGEIIKTTGALDEVQASFPAPPFLRCHKSYLVNLSHVKWLDRELMVFEMDEGQNVHIRRQSLKTASLAFEDYMFSLTRGLGNE